MSRRALTLIELLVVIAIIAVLASLTLASIGPLKERAKRLDTGRRLQQVVTGIQQYRPGGVDLTTTVLRAAGHDLRFAPLRQVLSDLTTVHGLSLRSAKRAEHLPPNLGVRWEKRPDPATWPFPDTGIDYAVTFLDRQTWLNKRATETWRVFDFYDDVLPDRAESDYGQPGNSASVQRFIYRRANESPVGERLDRTLEVVPDAIRPPAWYLQRWPNLRERAEAGPSGEVVFRQESWPVSDWDRDAPGAIPPIWPWPWGRKSLSRIQGTEIDQIDPHHLGELSPLATIALLQLAGILPPGTEGAEAYRAERSPGRSWNDRWGRPLVVVFAAFVAPRYDFDPDDTFRHEGSGQIMPKLSRNLLGGRDFLLTRATETYGGFRSAYVAAGAVGPVLRDPLPEPWSAAEDAVTLRRLWLQVREVCDADDWNADAIAAPPWEACRTGSRGRERCLLTAPAEIR